MCGCWGACVVAEGACVVAGGVCMVAGGMHGHRGACVVAGGHAWLHGGHVWLPGGVHGYGGRHVWLLGGHAWLWGVCMVARGCAWLVGGMHGCQGSMHGCQRGMCGCWGGGMCGCGRGVRVGYDEIQSMSGRYASYWNAFLFLNRFPCIDRIEFMFKLMDKCTAGSTDVNINANASLLSLFSKYHCALMNFIREHCLRTLLRNEVTQTT